MVHFEVYMNKYVVSIAPFSTPACPDCSQNIQKTALFCMFSGFNFSSIFPGVSADPICPYVRTAMSIIMVVGQRLRSRGKCLFSAMVYGLIGFSRLTETESESWGKPAAAHCGKHRR